MTAAASKRARVAILDDHFLVRDGLAHMLLADGFDVVVQESDAQRFLEALRCEPDVVAIVDLVLEGGDGFDVLETLRRTRPELPVLVLTGNASPAAIERCMRLGAAGLLDKVSAGHLAVKDALVAIRRGTRLFPVQSVIAATRATARASLTLDCLSCREREVLAYLAIGDDNLKIAAHLGISERTVKAHVSSLYKKLRQETRIQLALLAQSMGVRPPRQE